MGEYTYKFWIMANGGQWIYYDSTDRWLEAKEWLLEDVNKRYIEVDSLPGGPNNGNLQLHDKIDTDRFEAEYYWSNQVNTCVEETLNYDAVERPKHYQDIVPGMQYMEMMQYMLPDVDSHLLGQVYKYLMRNGKKDDEAQELGKVLWYTRFLRARKIVNRNIKYEEVEDIINGKISS